MKHLGDISKIHGAKIEPVDLITFGSPCQDLSVAGKRAGLKHETNGDEKTTRSGLFMEAVRIIKEMREATDGKYPRFALWENVPGAFSSNKGEDFRIVLEEIIKIVETEAIMPEVPKTGWPYADSYRGDGWSLAYRVFDAQHWGVPQRRRRIYLVADFAGERAEEILFKREGLRGHLTESPAPRERITAYVEGGSGAENRKGKCYGISSFSSNAMLSDNPHSGIYEANTSRTLDLNGGNPACNQGGIAVVEPICMATQQGGAEIRTDDKAPTVTAAAGMSGNNQPVIAYVDKGEVVGIDTYNGMETGTVSATLGVNCGISTGRNGVIIPTAFTQNQRDEVRHLGEKAGALQAQPGMKQQTFIIDSIGGQAETANEADVATTLKATHYKMPPCVAHAAGFCSEHSAKSRSIGYQKETSPTLRAGTVPATIYDARGNGNGEVAATVTGDHENRITDYTNLVCATDIGFFNSLKNISPSLLARGYKDPHLLSYPAEMHDFIEEHNRDVEHQQDRLQLADGAARTLAAGTHGMASHLTKTVINDGVQYIVRRLTPTECARLQGFADRWGDIEPKDSFTPEEYEFWLDVRNTYAAINGKQVKDYTEKQMLTWYNKLHTDSAEYKMWGNGIALPTALYCMQGIADALEEDAA